MKPFYSLSDFPERKSAGKNYVTRCPQCKTMHLHISKARGLYHCFYAGCGFSGILADFCKPGQYSFGGSRPYAGTAGSAAGTARAPRPGRTADGGTAEAHPGVPMIPSDYKPLSPEVMRKIKPLTDTEDCTDPDELAARRYLKDIGISPATAQAAGLGMPNSGKTDFLNDLTRRIMQHTGRFVCFLSFEVPDKNRHMARMVSLLIGKANTALYTREQLAPSVEFLDSHMIHLDMREAPPTPENILNRADLVRRRHPLKYLVVDPYLFVETQGRSGETETQAIKAMLTRFQTWGRTHHIWVVIVAHPRSLKTVAGSSALEPINMYTISGSANWANLADFIFAITRVNEPGRAFTRLDMLKVRDQDQCHTGTVFYTREPCGRYNEHESEEACLRAARE